MATTSTLVEPVTQADYDIAEHKLLRSYVSPVKVYAERAPSARALGPCLLGAKLQESVQRSGGSDWKAAAQMDGLLVGMQGAGDMLVPIDARNGTITGIAVWPVSQMQIKLECTSGVALSTMPRAGAHYVLAMASPLLLSRPCMPAPLEWAHTNYNCAMQGVHALGSSKWVFPAWFKCWMWQWQAARPTAS
jgi:hypothetical protein